MTAITRHDSQSTFPEGVEVKKVDYDQPQTLVAALRGQDALVITLSGQSQLETLQKKLIDAAVEAGVRWIMPNEWGFDTANQGLVEDIVISKVIVSVREHLKQQTNVSFTSMITGFWYEWSLAIPPAFGININKRTATLFDDGTAKITTSTWPQVGRAVASFLALPIDSNDSKTPSLNDFKNQLVYIGSFQVSQLDMLQSIYRVTNTKESDWTITSEPARQRRQQGVEEMANGSRIGFVKAMYTRVFYDDKAGDCEDKLINKQLGLPKEDLDEATKRTVQRAKDIEGQGWTD